MIKNRAGFTLIEILIVVAIIAILASVVLVGLGPTQQLGRDARRVSDIHEVQNGLELFYQKSGAYPVPTTAAWGPAGTAGSLTGQLVAANIGINNVPNDPSSGKNYIYAWTTGGSDYVLGAVLENPNSSAWQSYQKPNLPSFAGQTSAAAPTCVGNTGGTPDMQYCISL